MLTSRRTILGAMGAAALSKIVMPWRAEPSDILVASTIDEATRPALKVTPLEPGDDRYVIQELTFPLAALTYVKWFQSGCEPMDVEELYVRVEDRLVAVSLIGKRHGR